MEDRNKIIDECIDKIKSMVKQHCSDHTPYWGNCGSCGDTCNWDELPDPEDVIEGLEELKTVGG
jgi:hypothetical protein